MRIGILLIFYITSGLALKAQTDYCNIKGKIVDTSGVGLSLASVMLLDPADSTLIEYCQADDAGQFLFKNVIQRPYLLKSNYVSYLPLQIIIDPKSKIFDLGKLTMVGISKELFEVVIKAAKAPMTIKGDTIEYDATTFKVPAGSTVEDLLRKLPGLEIDQQGAITSDGKNVNRVTVDGKSFFGGDPKAATKNLPAEGISKVQVFNDYTEEQKLTGQKKLNSDKAMNLELKDEFKKGGFGKIIASIGTENTKELKGNYNKFNSKHQFSIIGSGTNTGRNGLSWNDYQDFKGSNSFNWGDDGDFGFSNGSNYRFYNFDDGEDDESSIVNNFFGGDNYGFPKKVSAGLNYNFDNKKTKISSMYFYDLNNLYSNAYRTQNFLYSENPYNTLDTASRDNNRMSHRVEFRLEQELDSFNSIVVKSNQSIGSRNNLTNNVSHSFNPDQVLENDQIGKSTTNSDNLNSQNSIIFRRKFKKKGRSLGLSGAYIIGESKKSSLAEALNSFYGLSMQIDSIGHLNQKFETDQTTNTFKVNGLWNEPIGKRISARTFYNFNNGLTDYTRLVSDIENNQSHLNNFLSRDYNNTNGYNRLGQSISYNYEGLGITLGGAFQEIYLKSTYSTKQDSIPLESRKVYQNWIPNVELEYELSNGMEASIDYNRNVSAPNSRDLLPIVDNTNSLFITVGNPALQPRSSSDISVSFRKFDRLKFTNLWSRIVYTYNDVDIIYSKSISVNRVSTTQPINIKGTSSIYANLNYGFPIIKNKLTFNLGYNYNFRKDKTLVNSIEDEPKTFTHGFNFRSNISPSEAFTVFLNGNYRISDQESNSISRDSSRVISLGGNAEMNIKLPRLFFFNSSFNINSYRNSINNFSITVPLLNLSVYKLFLKDNRAEIRFSVYDLFNKTVGIQQSVNSFRIVQSETLSLARYALLSFTYNMRGMKSQLDKQGRRGMMYF
ncbi:MAG: outer membrane beta-barrel protein [Saprospiraceae bacterium]